MVSAGGYLCHHWGLLAVQKLIFLRWVGGATTIAALDIHSGTTQKTLYTPMIIVPTCLKGNEIAIIWFKKHAKLLNLLPEQIESFALVAEIYSSWRNSTNTQDKKTFGDQYFRFAKEFNLLPRSAKKKEAKQANQIGNYFNK